MRLSSILSFITVLAAAGALITTSGCGGNKAADAQTPPPQTLSEPVRLADSTPPPAAAPAPEEPVAMPVSTRSQKVGETRELSQFVSPDATPVPPPRTPPAMPAPATATAGGQRYHTLAKGESLAQLSRKYNVGLRKIIDANHFKDPNHLAVGTKVCIP
ncbi:MAG TPA: LysM domain-containing protein [Planctomycetota bacterium]|jgi:LysM repeat protein